MGRSVWRAGFYQVTESAGWIGVPGAADRSLAGQRMRQPICGSGRPRKTGALAGRAQVRVDLAGDVTLQAADDLLLGQAFLAAPRDVGAGGRMRAHPGDHDPPQGVVGLPVTAAVEPPAGDLPGRSGDR